MGCVGQGIPGLHGGPTTLKVSAAKVLVPDITAQTSEVLWSHALMDQSSFGGTKGTYTILGREFKCYG